jgi:hypothetical protein
MAALREHAPFGGSHGIALASARRHRRQLNPPIKGGK